MLKTVNKEMEQELIKVSVEHYRAWYLFQRKYDNFDTKIQVIVSSFPKLWFYFVNVLKTIEKVCEDNGYFNIPYRREDTGVFLKHHQVVLLLSRLDDLINLDPTMSKLHSFFRDSTVHHLE